MSKARFSALAVILMMAMSAFVVIPTYNVGAMDSDDDEGEDDGDEEEEEEQTKKEEVKVPTTKSAMIKQLFDKVNGMKKEEVSAKWKDLMGVAEAEDLGGPTPSDSDNTKDEVGKKKKKIKISMPEINVKEDIDALVEGEEL